MKTSSRHQIADHDHASKIGASTPLEHGVIQQLRRVKLDLLPVLYALLQTRSVSRSARLIGISQPAVSHALRDLRVVFDDDLLVELGRRPQLTARAERLIEPLGLIIESLDQLYAPATAFDPTTEKLTIVIGAVDYIAFLLAPLLTAICAHEAPRVAFEFVEAHVRAPNDLARYDFVIAPRGQGEMLGKRIGRAPLWSDDYVCLAADDDSCIDDPINPDAFRARRHVAYHMRHGSSPSITSLVLPPSVLEVAPACTVASFLVLGYIVEATDCLALVPRKLAETLAALRPLRAIELDYDNKMIHLDLFWNLASTQHRGHAWVRDLMIRAAAQVGEMAENRTRFSVLNGLGES